MVTSARKDPKSGAEELQSFSWTALAIGGLVGSITAAYLTEVYEPRHCFLVASAFGLVLLITAIRLPIEAEQIEPSNGVAEGPGFWADLKHNMREVGEVFKLKEFRNINIYIILAGVVRPSFDSFEYFFYMDILNISMWTYSMLGVMSFGAMLIGTQIYSIWFCGFEYRTMIIIDALISMLIQPMKYILVFRLNIKWGLPDLALIMFSSTVMEAFNQCLVYLPFTVLMAKICPRRIEATSFAVLVGLLNLRELISAWMGSAINDNFVGVTKDDMSQYWVLLTISFVCSFLPLAFLWLLPTRQQVDDLALTIKETKQLAYEPLDTESESEIDLTSSR